MNVLDTLKKIALGLQNRSHTWEPPVVKTPQEGNAFGLYVTASYDKPLEYHLVAVKIRK